MNTIDIFDIGTKKKQLPDPTTVPFESLQDYLDIAKRIVCKHADRIKPGLAGELMKNEDALANIVHNIMMADWTFNGKGTRKGWRSQMGKWALYNYIARADKRYRSAPYSLDTTRTYGDGTRQSFYDVLSADSEDQIRLNERGETIRHLIGELMKVAVLSDRQREILRLHYLEGLSVNDIIADHDGKTRQNVSCLLRRGIAALKDAANSNPKYREMFIDEVLS